jgi:hypothetical protein
VILRILPARIPKTAVRYLQPTSESKEMFDRTI